MGVPIADERVLPAEADPAELAQARERVRLALYAMWLAGAADIGRWLRGPGAGCRGSRLIPTRANGCPAFGQYRVDPAGGHTPWALQVLETDGSHITGFHTFLDTAELFPAFGLPEHLAA